MSLVYITHHNENVSDLEMKADEVKPKPKIYHSKFWNDIRREKKIPHVIDLSNGQKLITSSKICKHQTMGYAETPLTKPRDFQSRSCTKWRRLNEHVCPPFKSLPPLPSLRGCHNYVTDASTNIITNCRPYNEGERKHTNFIALNIERIAKLKLKKTNPRYVDTAAGETHNLLNTGLVPQYSCTKKFGKVPTYLHKHKEMLAEYRRLYQLEEEHMCRRKQFSKVGARKMSAEERNNILTGLKENYKSITKTYQSLPLCTDTIAKKLRKTNLENQLRQLEQDIYLMESKKDIYISQY